MVLKPLFAVINQQKYSRLLVLTKKLANLAEVMAKTQYPIDRDIQNES